MSSNQFSTIKRLDIVNYLEEEKKLKPTSDEYSNEYVAFVCDKLGIERSDVHYEVFIDISKIKSFYKDTSVSYKFDFMIKKHKKFFNAFVKLKKLPPNPTSYTTTSASTDNLVCFLFYQLWP